MINKQQLMETLEDNFVLALDIARRKNADYSDPTDAFENFEESAYFARVPTEIGILLRTHDKLARYRNLFSRTEAPEVNESITDTLLDAINYLNLLLAWHKLGADQEETEGSDPFCGDEPEADKPVSNLGSGVSPLPGEDKGGGKFPTWFENLRKKLE